MSASETGLEMLFLLDWIPGSREQCNHEVVTGIFFIDQINTVPLEGEECSELI